MADRTAPWPRRPSQGPVAAVTPRRAANGKIRWITALTPEADAAFAASVAAVVPAIERRLGPGVIADRAHPGTGSGPARLAPWRPARRRWQAIARRRLDGNVRALVVADVRDCFASIGPDAVARALADAAAPPETVDRVIACLRAFSDEGVRGLPIGPAASALLGNVVLARLDDVLDRHGVPHLRWVDDVLAFAPCGRDARRSLDGLRLEGACLGLDLHDAKTRVVDDPDEARALVGRSNSPGAAAGVA